MHKTLVAGLVLLLLAVAGYVGMARQAQPAAPAEVGALTTGQAPQEPQGSAMPVPTERGASVVEKIVNPTPVSSSPVAAEPDPGPSYFTAADVATHNQYTDCWISVNGSVFDMTGFDSVHPGGREAIMKLCGKDGTRMFMKEDEHAERNAWKEIQQFRVGELRG